MDGQFHLVSEAGDQLDCLAVGVFGDDLLRGFQDGGRGAVVLLQDDLAGVGEILLKAPEEAGVGPAEAVDGLIRVADDAEIGPARGQQPQQLILPLVQVLIFVHRDPTVAGLQRLQDLLVFLQQAHGLEDEVVEVEGVVSGQCVLVGPIADGEVGIVGAEFGQAEVVRAQKMLFGRGKLPQKTAAGLAVGAQEEALDQLLPLGFVEDAEIGGQMLPQDLCAKGVKGADGDAGRGLFAHQGLQALPHLLCGLVGEGDGQHAGGIDAFFGDEVGDAGGEGAGFAGAGPGHDDQRAVGGEDCGPLGWVERRKE